MRKIKLFGINTAQPKNDTIYSLEDAEFLTALGITADTPGDAIGEITYFTCMKTLAEIMGKLDVRQYRYDEQKGRELVRDSRMEDLLNVEPNDYYTASTLKQAVEMNRNHYGNAYVYAEEYKTGEFKGGLAHLWLLPSNEVSIWVDSAGIFGKTNAIHYQWNDSKTGKSHRFNALDIMHFKSSVTFDGIVGRPIRDVLKQQINTALYGTNYIEKLYKGNMAANKIVLNYTGDLEKSAQKALAVRMEEFSESVGTGAYLPLPQGITAQPLDSKLVDSEFSILRQANALQVAAAFGISPNFINDYSKSSYANSVTQQQALYTNTMMPIFKLYGEEYSRRLLNGTQKQDRRYEIDPKALFKLNPIEQMDYVVKGIQSMVLTPNEAREELDKPYYDDDLANKLLGNGNMITIDTVGTNDGKNAAKGGDK